MIGIEFKKNCKSIFSFLEKEYSFIVSDVYAENDGKSDWIIYRSNNRAVSINYDWHDEYLYIIIYQTIDINSNLPELGESSKVLYIENLLKASDIDLNKCFHAEMNNYTFALKNAAELLQKYCNEIIIGSRWISNKDLLK